MSFQKAVCTTQTAGGVHGFVKGFLTCPGLSIFRLAMLTSCSPSIQRLLDAAAPLKARNSRSLQGASPQMGVLPTSAGCISIFCSYASRRCLLSQRQFRLAKVKGGKTKEAAPDYTTFSDARLLHRPNSYSYYRTCVAFLLQHPCFKG